MATYTKGTLLTTLDSAVRQLCEHEGDDRQNAQEVLTLLEELSAGGAFTGEPEKQEAAERIELLLKGVSNDSEDLTDQTAEAVMEYQNVISPAI